MRGRRKRGTVSHASGELLENRLLFDGVTLNGSSGADVIEIQKSGENLVLKLNFTTLIDVDDADIDEIVVNANGGGDTIYLDQTGDGNTVDIYGGDGADTLRLADLTSELDGNISGSIIYDGGNNTDSLVIDDDGSGIGKSHEFGPGTFSTYTLFSLDHFSVEQVTLAASSGNDFIQVTANGVGTDVLVDANGGSDTLAYVGTIGHEDILFGPSVLDVNGTLFAHEEFETFTFDGGGGTDALAIDGVDVDLVANAMLDDILITEGRLDLGTNDLLIDYDLPLPIQAVGSWNGTAYTGITGLIASGHNAGAWDGDGLVTTTADAMTGLTTLGVGEAAEVFGGATADWEGFTIDATTIIVKYTYGGDANLDGIVSGDDYAAIDFNVAVSGSYGWYNGDFNYDGIISGDDYATIDFNIVAQGPPL